MAYFQLISAPLPSKSNTEGGGRTSIQVCKPPASKASLQNVP
jgi:hypothetical protein